MVIVQQKKDNPLTLNQFEILMKDIMGKFKEELVQQMDQKLKKFKQELVQQISSAEKTSKDFSRKIVRGLSQAIISGSTNNIKLFKGKLEDKFVDANGLQVKMHQAGHFQFHYENYGNDYNENENENDNVNNSNDNVNNSNDNVNNPNENDNNPNENDNESNDNVNNSNDNISNQ